MNLEKWRSELSNLALQLIVSFDKSYLEKVDNHLYELE